MPIRSLADLRKQAGPDWNDSSDEDLISAYASSVELDPVDVARRLGYDPGSGGKTAKRTSAAVDNYQAGLYGLGEELTGAIGLTGASEWLGERRRANELQANVASARARDMGAIDSIKDVGGLSDFGDYAAGLAIQSAPYAAEALTGGLIGRGVMTGTRAALSAARTAGDEVAVNAARSTLNKGSLLGGTSASYPSSVGDILQNQREQSGEADLGSALALGVPYAGLNAVGLEGALAKGQLFRNSIRSLDNIQGVKGGLARAGVTGTITGLSEGASELGQEFVNQAGRMVVDPNEEFFSEGAKDRFLESFAGGAVLGKVSGAGLGGWRRSGGSLLGGSNTQLSDNANPDGNSIKQAINGDFDTDREVGLGIVPPLNPYDVGGYVSKQQAGLDTGLQFDSTGGQQNLVFGDGPVQEVQPGAAAQQAAPAAAAPAPQQGTQQAPSGQQAPQDNSQVLSETGQRYNVTQKSADGVSSVDIGGRLVIGINNVKNFLTELATLDAQKPPVQRQVEAALMRVPGLVKVNPTTGTAKALSAAVTKAAEKFQLLEAQTVEQAAQILNAQIEALANAGKGQTDTNVTNLAQAYEALTGQQAPAYELTQQNMPKKGTTVPTTNQGAANEGQAQQVSPGVGAVPQQVGASPGSPGPNVRPQLVQPVQPGSVLEGSLGLQVGQQGASGARVGAGNAPSTVDVVGSQEQAQVTEGTPDEKEAFVTKLFNAVFGQRDGGIVADLYEGVAVKAIGDKFGVSASRIRQIKGQYFEKQEKGQPLQFKPMYVERLRTAVSNAGMSFEDVRVFLGDSEESVAPGEIVNDIEATEGTEDSTPQSAEEVAVAKTDEELTEETADKNDANLRIVSEKNVSAIGDVSEKNQSSSKFQKAVEEQKQKGAKDPVAEALKRIDPQDETGDLSNLALEADAELMGKIAAELKRREKIRTAKGGNDAAQTKQDLAEEAWNGLRETMPDAIPEWNALSKAQQEEVLKLDDPSTLNLKNVERIVGMEQEGFAAQRLNFEYLKEEGGVKSALKDFEQSGVMHVLSAVDRYELLPDSTPYPAFYQVKNGQIVISFKLDDISKGTQWSAHLVRHEIAHAVDMASQGGVYSIQPELRVSVNGDQTTGLGPVARELVALHKTDPAWSAWLEYPLGQQATNKYNAVQVQAEIFAQLWSGYTNESLRARLFEQAPLARKFMEEVIKDVQSTKSFQTKTETVAEQRSQGFQVRNAGRPAEKTERVSRPGGFAILDSKAKAFLEGLDAATVYQNLNRLPPRAQKPARTLYTVLANLARKSNDYVVFTPAVINRAVKAGIKSAKRFLDLNLERGAFARKMEKDVEKIVDMYALVPQNERGTGDGSVNKFLFDSTRENKWGFEADWQENPREADADMAARFESLSKEAQAFIKAVFKHGDDILAFKKQTVMDYSATVYDGLIAKAQQNNDQKELAELQAQKRALLTKYERIFRLREGMPYAPIKRSGQYVVIAKSAEYRQAQEENDGKRIKELESDPEHYHVSFTDTEAQARTLQEQLLEQGHFGKDKNSVIFRERQVQTDQIYGGDSVLAGLTKLRARVDGTNDEMSSKLARMITDLYLDTLAETSARKSEIRRKGVAGEVDMLSSFARQGSGDANFMAAVKYDGQIQETIRRMRQEEADDTQGDPNRKSELVNEILKRYVQSLEYNPAPVTQKITRLTSVYYLASSPGYYLQNMTQPFLMSLPVMAGRHDAVRSANALVEAYTDLKQVIKSAKLFSQMFDFDQVPADVRDVIQRLVAAGKIDIGMNTELGEIQVEGSGKYGAAWNKVDKGLRLAVQKVEAMNRLSTAIAAYRLELDKTKDKDAAYEYAATILDDTHGDYTPFVAPRAFNTNIGKVALQFRKFQLIQLGLLAKLFKEAGFSTPEKRVAMKSLTYLLGTTAVAAGMRGLPGYAAIAFALGALFGDDDEPYDIDKEIRKAIGDEDIANLILRGAPTLAGVDLSGKVGMGNALSILPFTDFDNLNGAKTLEIAGTLLGGPAAGMAARMADGFAYIANGDLYKGMELVVPKGVGDAMKAYRISQDGVTNKRGDVLLPAEEVSAIESFYQAIGLQPVEQAVRSEKQGQLIQMEQKFKDRSARLKNDYVAAFKKGDREGMNEARDAWMKLQETRTENGFTRRPLSELLKAPRDQAKRERNTIGGVQYTKANRRFVQSLSEEE